MLVIRWDQVPKEIRDTARPLVKQHLWLLPCWCRTLNIGWSSEHKGGSSVTASSDASPEYRFGTINLHGPWLDIPSRRRSDIIHELLHIPEDTLRYPDVIADAKERARAKGWIK